MKNLLSPKWILLINIIPIILLFLIYYGEYNIISSLLSEENIVFWRKFGLVLLILGVLNLVYAVYLLLKKKEVSPWYGAIALISYIPFIYLYFFYSDKIIPMSIPNWMIPGNIELYVLTFIMPTLAYSLIVIMVHFTPAEKKHTAWINFAIAIGFPVLWLIFTSFIRFFSGFFNDHSVHIIFILLIIGTLIFIFFLSRGVYIIALKNKKTGSLMQLAWKIPIAIILPFMGLAVNNGLIFNQFGQSNTGIFGNFQSFWFYALALLNGILICLPNLENKLYRLLLFAGRCITFAYTFYFFMVFLPFLPLSVVAIVAIGTGFLMLTPLALFIIHLQELSTDFVYLKTYFHGKLIGLAAIAGFLFIPLYITASFMHDRKVLNETLDYIYNPNYSKTYKIDSISLAKTLEIVKQHKEKSRNDFFGDHIPYISAYFNWLVLDNLTLSDIKIAYIERVFFNKPVSIAFNSNSNTKNPVISKINHTSTYDPNQHIWKSWVDMEITSIDTTGMISEYATSIELPVGCWISDYYLNVAGKQKQGILAEKKSATWVYTQIRDAKKDPGILCYLTGNKVAYRVFPFTKGESRKTGIEFIHRDPVCIKIDSCSLSLGSEVEHNETPIYESMDKNVVYISAKEKSCLKEIHRKPYYHFVVDVSAGKENQKDQFIQLIEKQMKENLISNEQAKISFVNSFTSTISMKDNWKEKYRVQTFVGGFYMDRAIKTILYQAYNSKSNTYPVIVCITTNLGDAIIENDFSDLSMAYPECDFFYSLDMNGKLKPHSLKTNPLMTVQDSTALNFDHSVLVYPDVQNPIAYLPNDHAPSILLKKEIFEINKESIHQKNWQSALCMQGKWISLVLHPETSDKEWPMQVKYSLISKVMSPLTSYIVLENEAQEKIMLKKQEQVLSSENTLDIGENVQIMSEPALILPVALLLLFLVYQKRKKKGFFHQN